MNISDLIYLDENGFHYEDYPTILEWLKDEYRAIYGADVYLEADSQDGQYIAIQAKAMYDSAVVAASIFNSFSPSTAQGAGLARIVKINGIKKQSATHSTCDVTITGTVGTTITNGVVQDTLNQKWNLPASVTIPLAGSITVTATSVVEGAITAQVGTLTKIYTPTLGWQSVTNANAATVGEPVETDAELRLRQSTSVAIPSLSVFEGTKGAVANVTGVVRSVGYENDSSSTDANGIPANSIAMVVDGGDTNAIASAIALHKTPGTRTYGTTSATVTDRYGEPNVINFYRPTIKDVKVQVQVTALAGYTTGYDTLIKQAVADAINALKIGDDVILTKLYVPANLPGTTPGATFNIIDVQIAFVGNSFGTSNLTVAFNEAAACSTTNVTVVVVP